MSKNLLWWTAAILLFAANAHAANALLYTDSVYVFGTPTTTGQYLAAERPDYTWTLSTVSGRNTTATADLTTLVNAQSYAVVAIALGVNDPGQLADCGADHSLARLQAMCAIVSVTGAECVLITPMHGTWPAGVPIYRGACNLEAFTDSLSEAIITSGESYINAHASIPLSVWTTCCDFWGLHPNTDACRHTIADFDAPRLP